MIIVSRDVIPVSICDISIEICNRTLPGTLIYLGLVAVVTVDKNLLHSNLTAPKISDKVFRIGDDIENFLLDGAYQLIQKDTKIKDIGGIANSATNPPRWRMLNIEVTFLMDYTPSLGGFHIDPIDKSVVALSMSVNQRGTYAINYNFYIRPIIGALKRSERIVQRYCGWSFSQESLSECLALGLKQERAIRMVQLAKAQNTLPRPVFVNGQLRPPSAGSDCEGFQIGDIIIEIDDNPVIRMADIHVLTEVTSARILVSRNGEELLFTVPTYELQSEWTETMLCWAGAIFHRTHDPVLEQISPEFAAVSRIEEFPQPEKGVYICSYFRGSSGSQIPMTNWVLEVDGRRVRSMEDMLEIVKTLKGREDGEYIRAKLLHRAGVTGIVTIRLDNKFWPAFTLEQKDGKWVRTELE
jgi:pro-apoptotic serine protease NMA111